MPKVVVTDTKGLVQESGSGVFIQGDDSQSTVPAYIALRQADGGVSYLLVDNNGKLRIHNAKPAAHDDGAVVGLQS
tara:strand:+ start:2705 stop:2932 length:228 start_codon:yes stop_codon:yes gene_type:complete